MMDMLNYDRKALKERAKVSLRGVQPRTWKVTLLYWLLVALIPGAITLIIQWVSGSGVFAYLQRLYTDPVGWSMEIEAMDTDELLGYYRSIYVPAVGAGLISTFVSILVNLFQLIMSYGYANYSLKLYRGESTGTGDIFAGFPVAGRAIGAGILTSIFEILWTLLATLLGICATLILAMTMAAFGDSTFVMVLGVLLMIAVWVAVVLFSTFIAYRYSLTPYFILTTDMGIMEAIRESKAAMRGNLGRRFVLDLSFIGWELVNGLIAMGVVLVGYFILIFALSFSMVFQTMDTMQYVDPSYFESEAYLNQLVGQLMGRIFAGVSIIAVVAEIATLPIGLWLTAYRGSASAGFFLAATGQDDAPASAPASDYIPPQPSDIWNNVPTPPSFTPSAPSAPETPAVPGAPEADGSAEAPPVPVPETPAVSETPEAPEAARAPEESVEAASAEAEPPAEAAPVAEETAPETPAVTEDAPSKEED